VICSTGRVSLDSSLSNLGFVLVAVGSLLAFVAVVLMLAKASTGGSTKGGGIVMIGPIPIIFGSDKNSAKALMVLAIILIVAVLAFMVVPTILLSR